MIEKCNPWICIFMLTKWALSVKFGLFNKSLIWIYFIIGGKNITQGPTLKSSVRQRVKTYFEKKSALFTINKPLLFLYWDRFYFLTSVIDVTQTISTYFIISSLALSVCSRSDISCEYWCVSSWAAHNRSLFIWTSPSRRRILPSSICENVQQKMQHFNHLHKYPMKRNGCAARALMCNFVF